jgi:hypothetical protein
MMANTKDGQMEAKPLFAYVLNIRVFLIIYFIGFLVLFGWVHMAIQINDQPTIVSAQLSTVIYAFLAPSVFILAKKIFDEFNLLFRESNKPIDNFEMSISEREELANLFSDSSDFDRYRSRIYRMVNNSKEKIIAIALGSLFLPLNLLQDSQKDFYSPIFTNFPFSIQAVEYLAYYVFWVATYALLFSIILLIFSVTYALLGLKKEKHNFKINNTLKDVISKFKEMKKNGLFKSNIEQLNASFKTFSSSLSTISSFVLSLSLKIAFVGAFSTVPALIYFVTTGRISVVWYGACIMGCSLSIVVFILGQYGAWTIWSETEIRTSKLLTAICAKYQEICPDKKTIKGKSIADIDCIIKTGEDIEKATPVTYTSSAIFKVAAANFLAFGPIIIEQVVTRLVLK